MSVDPVPLVVSDMSDRPLTTIVLPTYLRALLTPHVDLEDFQSWRARILSLILAVTVVLGTVAAVPSIALALSEGLWSVALIDGVALLWGVTIWLRRTLPYRVRAWNFCILLYLLGLSLLLTIGTVSQDYLMAFPVMAALLLDLGPALAALLLNAVTLPLAGYLIGANLQIPGFEGQPLFKWFVITVNFTLVSSMITISSVMLLKGLEKALAKRRDSEERYRTLIDWTPEPLAVHDGITVMYANPAAIRLFGARTLNELLGRPVVSLVHPDSLAIVQARLAIHNDHAGTLPLSEQKLLRLDGTVISAEVQSARIVFGGAAAIQIAIHDITDRKAAQEQVQQLAFSDSVTGLPNRRLLMDRLKQALSAGVRHRRQGALAFVDLDDFKTFNETLGHERGDLLLKQVAMRLSQCIREGDTVARLGSDEFVLVLEDLSSDLQDAATQAEAVCEKILVALNQPYVFDHAEHYGTASIGITLFGAHRDSTTDPLMQAELAMYQAKAAGRNTLRFFDPQMQSVVRHRAALEAALHEALVKNQFFLQYQVQVTDAGRIIGAEALVRWNDPMRGTVLPGEFITLAEATGLILQLGHWVLETACAQLTLWAGRPDMAQWTIAVNVSARQFHQSDFVAQVMDILRRTGANPNRLKLELTESLLVTNVEDVIAKMNALKAQGVGFALDDFGTGYSTLLVLKRLPLDQLKIDQSFVSDILVDPNDAAIARMVVALADSVGLSVIAEGVETAAQRDCLAALGCKAYQGYLFGRPLSISEFEASLQHA